MLDPDSSRLRAAGPRPVAPPETATLANLAVPVAALSPDTTGAEAYELFSASPNVYALAVVGSGRQPLGLLNRFTFMELMSQPFGRDVLATQPVALSMDTAPLIVDERTPIDTLVNELMAESRRHILDGFIVTRNGAYLGIGSGLSAVRQLLDWRRPGHLPTSCQDGLTGAPNRELFAELLARAVTTADRQGGPLGLLHVDVDRFMVVNDTLGHGVGDEVLRQIVTRMTGLLRTVDTVGRIGGDEFGVLLPDLRQPADAELVSHKLLDALRAPYLVNGVECNASCSIGIAVYPVDASSDASLQLAADLAVHRAKQVRNTVERYTPELSSVQTSTLRSYAAVRRAIDCHHIAVRYQPQVDCRTGRIIGVEALVRWAEPGRSADSAEELIRLAEDAGLMAGVTTRVLDLALPQVHRWKEAPGCASLTLAVNISGLELRDGTFAVVLAEALQRHAFPATDLELEITETALMHPTGSALSTLQRLRQLGVRLAIDDFGTGYSNLSRLQGLPVQVVKIDRAFVQGIDGADGGALARAVLQMGHSLGLTVVAEGVETLHQRSFLESHWCDVLQGFLLGRPMPAPEFEALLSASHARDVALLDLAPIGTPAATSTTAGLAG